MVILLPDLFQQHLEGSGLLLFGEYIVVNSHGLGGLTAHMGAVTTYRSIGLPVDEMGADGIAVAFCLGLAEVRLIVPAQLPE